MSFRPSVARGGIFGLSAGEDPSTSHWMIYALLVIAITFSTPSFAQSVPITNGVPTVITTDATLNNSFVMDVTDINFGIIGVTTAAGQRGELALDVTGAYDQTGNIGPVARIVPRAAAGQQGIIDLSGALANTVINIRYLNVQNLECGGCSVGNPDLIISRINDDMSTQAGVWSVDDADPDNDAIVGRGMSNGSGELMINIGAAIRTDNTNTRYESGNYEGSFDVILEY